MEKELYPSRSSKGGKMSPASQSINRKGGTMRGSGGRGGALGAPLCSRATVQEGSPEGGACFSDLMAVCQHLSANSGPCWNY